MEVAHGIVIAGSPSGDAGADRMTKKIAQLTKVIFHLNSKNEENEQTMQQLRAAHEKTIEGVLQDAKNKLAVLEEKYSKSISIQAHESMLEMMAEKHAKERDAMVMKEISAQAVADQALQALSQQFQALFADKTKEVNALKEEYERRQALHTKQIDDLNQAIKTAEQRSHQTSSSILISHEKELDQLRSLLTNEFQLEKDAAKRDFTKTLEAKTTQFQDDLQAQAKRAQDFLRMKLEEAQKDWENEKRNMTVMFTTKEQVALSQLDELRQQLSMGTTESAREISRLGRDLDEKNASFLVLNSKVADLEKLLALEREQVARLQDKLSQQQALTDKQSSELLTKQKAISDLDAYCKSNELVLEANAAEIARLQNAVSQYQSEAQRVSSAAATLSNAKGKVEIEMDQLRSKFEEEKKALLLAHKKEQQTMRAECDRAISSTKETCEREKVSLAAKLEAQMKEVQAKAQETTDRSFTAQQELRKQLDRVSQELMICMQRLGEKDALVKSLTSDISQLQSTKQYLSDKSAELEKTLERLRSEHDLAKTNAGRLATEMEHIKSQSTLSQSEISRQFEEKLKEAVQAANLKASQEQQEAISKLLQKHRDELQTITIDWNFRLSASQREKSAVEEQLQSLTKRMAAEITRNQQEKAAMAEDWTKERAKLESNHKNILEEVARRHAAELERLQLLLKNAEQMTSSAKGESEATWQKKLADTVELMKIEAQTQVEEERTVLSKAKVEELAALSETLNLTHEAETLILRNELSHRHGQIVSDLMGAHEREMIALRANHDTKTSQDKIKLDELTKSARELHSTVEEKSSLISKLQPQNASLAAELAQARTELQALGQDILTIRRESLETLAAKEKSLTEHYRLQSESIMTSYQAQINRTNAETEKKMSLMKDQLAILEEELGLTEEKYRTRGPRAEDAARMAELEALIKQQAEQIASLTAFNQRLNLEVSSREQSFNMMFKQAPNVGTLNPISPASRKSSSSKSTSSKLDPIFSTKK